MAVGNILGRAYIEVHSDASKFADELEKDVQAVADAPKVKKSAQKAGETVSENIVKGAKKKLDQDGPSIMQRLRDTFSKEKNKDRNFFQRVGATSAEGFTAGFQSALKGGSGLLSSLGSSLGNVGSAGPFAGVIGVLVAAGIPALIGLIVTLVNQVGALVNAVGLLPGLLAVTAAAIIPVVVGFQGFGDAISAVLSRDPEKIAEALKQISPAARKVVLEFQKMLPFFTQLKAATQEALFKPLVGALTKVQKALGPTFLAGFVTIAQKAGQFLSTLLWVMSSPAATAFFKNIFDTAARVYDVFTPGLIRFIQGLMSIAGGSTETLIELFTGLGNALSDFGDFLIEAVSNGDFKLFLDQFILALDKVIQFGKSSYNLIDTILGGADSQGQARQVFETIIEAIDTLTEFFASERGQQALKGMIFLAGAFLQLIQGVLLAFLLILSVVGDIVDLIKYILRSVGLVSDTVPKLQKIGGQTAGGLRDRNFAEGGIVTRPNLGWTGEDGPEAIIPLTNPRRAQQVIQQAGLGNMVGGDTQVTVYIGEEQVMARVDKRVGSAFKQFGRGLKYGPRPVGVGA